MNKIEEFNEFTWDVIRTLPRAYYYHINNIPYTLEHKPGLSSLYFFVKNKIEVDKFNPINDSSTYNFELPDFAKKEWLPPPLKEIFKGKVVTDKPIVVIQNKYALEWERGIFNFFSIDFLEKLFIYLKDKYQIVYIRPESNIDNYYFDENKILNYNDYEIIKQNHPYVLTIKQLINTYPDLDYNTLQYYVSAAADKHLTTSGGNACISSYFGGDVFIYDNPAGIVNNRGIWKTDSWLKNLGGANIFGFGDYESILNKIKERW